MKQIDLREGARRKHRGLSLFAVIQCWIRQTDGVAFARKDLERLLGLVRFKSTRVRWLELDLKELFPHLETYWRVGKTRSLHSVFVSRVPLKPYLPKGEMTTQQRITGIRPKGPRILPFEIWERPNTTTGSKLFEGLLPFFSYQANYDERFLTSYLALLSSGQISPTDLPALKSAPARKQRK